MQSYSLAGLTTRTIPMRNPTTRLDIDLQLRELNTLLDRPDEPYRRDENTKLVANIGNIHLYHDHNGYKIYEMANESGAVRDVTYKAVSTKRDVSLWLDGAIYVARLRLQGLL